MSSSSRRSEARPLADRHIWVQGTHANVRVLDLANRQSLVSHGWETQGVHQYGALTAIQTDGGVIAGIWGKLNFLWTEANGVVDLGTLPIALPSDPVYPNAIAADGALIFGGVGNPFFGIP